MLRYNGNKPQVIKNSVSNRGKKQGGGENGAYRWNRDSELLWHHKNGLFLCGQELLLWEKVIILLDEYDTPMQEAYVKGIKTALLWPEKKSLPIS